MRHLVAIPVLVLTALPATARHPGDRIDAVMAEREPAFGATGLRRTPRLHGTAPDGTPLRLGDPEDKIAVPGFAPAGCGARCHAQQALLREVQNGVNASPMHSHVVFPTVGPAPEADWEARNRQRIEAEQGAAAAGFGALSDREAEAPMAHAIARGGRHAGIFHGAGSGRVNPILYISELVSAPPPEPGLFDRFLGVFQ